MPDRRHRLHAKRREQIGPDPTASALRIVAPGGHWPGSSWKGGVGAGLDGGISGVRSGYARVDPSTRSMMVAVAHAGADAERDQRGLLAGALQLVEHGAQDHRAGGAERVAHRRWRRR